MPVTPLHSPVAIARNGWSRSIGMPGRNQSEQLVAMARCGGLLAMPFALLHGAGNGIFTIARGTVPLSVFGPENYGYRLGLLGAPSRILQSGAPIAFGLLIDRFGANALVFSSLACLAATAAFLAVAAPTSTAPQAVGSAK